MSTELTMARLSPVLWDTPGSTTATDPNGPPPNACALRLRDLNTGTEYQIQRRTSTRTNPEAPPGTPSLWAQHGDYMRIIEDPSAGRPSVYVRVTCGTWKVDSLVSVK